MTNAADDGRTAAAAPSLNAQASAEGAAVAVRCAGLTKQFESVVALKALQLEAPAGEVHAILGENGAGKSTFVKILGGTLQPNDGSLELFGEPVGFRSPRDAAKHGVSVAYQELSLSPELTVAQNIWVRSARLNAIGVLSGRNIRRKTVDLIKDLEAPSIDPDEKVKNLPMAERQVAEILKAVAAGSRVVVFDESTASLPAEETRWALALARELARAGRLVFYISHRIGEIREVSSRVTILRGGESVRSGLTADLSDDAMVEAMLGRQLRTLYPPPIGDIDESSHALVVRDLRAGKLRGIDFELRMGEILGVGGLQGQGQADLLLGLYGNGAGEITVNGKRRRIRSPKDALRAGIALVPDDRRLEGLLITKTIRENISLPNLQAVSRGPILSPLREVRVADDAVARLNVKTESAEQLVSKLSGGNQQKVVVAKLLMLDTSVLLLSDFTRGIDVGTKADLFHLLRELTAAGKSIVFYSSDAQELVQMCDRILVLRDGEISAVLSGLDRSEENVMRAAFGLELVRNSSPT